MASNPGARGGRPPEIGAFAENEWYYHLFPLQRQGDEVLSLNWVTDVATGLIDLGEATDEEAHFGPVLHWAHVLKSEQGVGGDWPAVVNARTGAPIGTERTRKPAEVLVHLGELMDSSEFDAAVELAKASTGPDE